MVIHLEIQAVVMGQAEIRHVHPKTQMGHVLVHMGTKVASMGWTKIGHSHHTTQVSHVQKTKLKQTEVGLQILVGAPGHPRIPQYRHTAVEQIRRGSYQKGQKKVSEKVKIKKIRNQILSPVKIIVVIRVIRPKKETPQDVTNAVTLLMTTEMSNQREGLQGLGVIII